MSQLLSSISENPQTSSRQFVCVPLAVIQLKLSAGALKALLALLSFRNLRTGQCNPGYAKLYERLGLAGTESDRRKLSRWIAALRAAGVLTGRKQKFGGVVWYEFPGLFSNGTSGVASNGTSDASPGAPHPLYEQIRGTERAAARIPPQRSNYSTRAYPERKSMYERVLECYYENQRRKAGGQ